MATSNERARQAFSELGGTLRTREALAAGIHPRTPYALRDAGELAQLARGVFRLASLPPLSDPDLVKQMQSQQEQFLSDSRYVERVAREELGKAKAGETIYRFTERKTNAFRVRH